MPGVGPPPVNLIHDLTPEEDQEVQKGDDGQQGSEPVPPEQGGNDVHGEEGHVRQGQPLGLHRDDVQQHQPGVGIQGGEGQEHGHAHVVGPHQHAVAEGVVAGDARDEGQDHAGEVVEVEFRRAPLPLQHGADEVHEVQRQNQVEGLRALRYKDEGQQPPDLPAENQPPVEV